MKVLAIIALLAIVCKSAQAPVGLTEPQLPTQQINNIIDQWRRTDLLAGANINPIDLPLNITYKAAQGPAVLPTFSGTSQLFRRINLIGTGNTIDLPVLLSEDSLTGSSADFF